ncbi:MAG: alginate lyase family protein [Micavibrio sp.]
MSPKFQKSIFARLISLALIGLFVVLGSCAPAQSQGQNSGTTTQTGDLIALPYDVSVSAPTGATFFCPKSPAPAPQNLILKSVYKKSDPQRATIDRKAQKVYEKETSESRRYENNLLRMANDYLRTGSTAKAQCVLDWLYEWAREDALLGETNDMGVAVRQWTLASLGSAYAQIRNATLDETKKEAVEAWLFSCAVAVIGDYPTDATQGRKFNNHLYWAAWAVTITGAALNNQEFYDWGIGRAKNAINNQFKDDGTLPLEMARGKRAMHYHIFAAAPLIMLAETGARNGDNLYDLRDGILHRYVLRIMDGIEDPDYFKVKSGSEQTDFEDLHPGHLVWLEAYNHRFPSPAIEEMLDGIRPLFLRRTGGDMTFLYSN